LFFIILNIILPIILVVLIGFFWNNYNKDFNPQAITKLVANIGLPALIYESITKSNLTINIYLVIFLSAVLVLFLGFIFGYVFIKIFKLPSTKIVTPLMHPNSGNMGIPLCLLAFGNEGLALAAAFASIVMVSHFTVNTAISSGNFSIKNIFLSPALIALIASMLILFYKIPIPKFLDNVAHILSGITIPLVLLSLGISLGKINIKSIQRGLSLGIYKLTAGPLIGLIIVYLLQLEGLTAKVVILQSSMPSAILTYLIASQNKAYENEIGSCVFFSTIFSAISLPIILYFIL